MSKCWGARLSVLGTALAIQIANGLNADEINILGALFNVIGDQLALIAATDVEEDASCNSSDTSNTANPTQKTAASATTS